jgi:ABC-type nitrate/sulfonate/bicarbonate transport system permease component
LITANLGGFIGDMQAKFNNRALIAGILWTLFIGYALYEAALWVERRITPWRATSS